MIADVAAPPPPDPSRIAMWLYVFGFVAGAIGGAAWRYVEALR
jgi:hypothetical protein